MRFMIKTTVKLLLRNKGFLFFLLITPLVSALILAQKVDSDVYQEKTVGEIIELNTIESRAIYESSYTSFIVKVYDGARTTLSEYVLERLAQNSMFSVCRADVTGLSETEVLSRAKKDAFDDRAGILVYLKPEFDRAVMDDVLPDGIELFRVSEDAREELFTGELSEILLQVYRTGSVCGKEVSATLSMLADFAEQIPEKQVSDLAGRNEIVLSDQQTNNKTQIGYAFAIITLGFMFSGVFAAHTVITEDNNKVFTRIMLTGTSTAKYFTAKFIVVILMCLLQTGVLAVCLGFVRGLDLGMPLPVFLLIIFLLGLIFGTFSMLTGILFGDIMSANYVAFAVWSISAMLSGLLFPIGDSSEMLRSISYLMPQRWFLDASEKLLAGISGAFPILIAATAAYLIIIISVGSVGLKIRRPAA